MAYPIVTKDGITINGIPDDIAKDDQRLKSMVASMRASGEKVRNFDGTKSSQIDAVMTPSTEEVPAQTQSLLQTLIPGGMEEVGRNVGGAVRGVAGGLAAPIAMIGDPLTMLVNKLLPENMKQMNTTQGLQQLLTMAGVPEAETEAEKIMQTAVSGLAGGGGQYLAGKAISAAPGVAGAVGNALAVAPMEQAVSGAASNTASEFARQQGASPLVQMGAGLLGGTAGGIATGLTRNPQTTGIVNQAEDVGVRLMTSDVLPPKTFAGKWLQAAGEKIPFTGTGGLRKAQQAERIAAVDDLVRQYGADDLVRNSTDVTQDLLAKRSADLSKWSGEKKDVITRLSGANVVDLPNGAKAVESNAVPLPRTMQKIDDSLNYLVGLKSKQNQPVIDLLSDWKQALQGQNLENVETLRKQVGDAFSAPEMASVRSTGDKILSDIYKPLNEDMGDYIKTAGSEADFTKWKVANTELSKMMGELDLPVLKSVLERGEASPEDVQRMLFSSKRSDVAALYRNLSEEGRAAARSAVISKAAYKNGEQVSPDKFAAEIGKLGNQVGVLFSGDDLKQIKGLTKVLNMTARAGDAALMPPTGIQAVIPVGGIGLGALGQHLQPGWEGAAGAIGAGAAIGLVPRVYESKPIRNILINMSQLKEGTPEAKAMLATLVSTISAMEQKSQGDTTPVKKEKASSFVFNKKGEK